MPVLVSQVILAIEKTREWGEDFWILGLDVSDAFGSLLYRGMCCST